MSSQMTVSPVADPLILAAAARGVERAIAAAGVNSHRVLELAGVDPARIADPLLRLELGDYCRLFDVAARETGDDFFGARFGQGLMTPEHFNAVSKLVVSAPTVRDALAALAENYRWIQENSRLQFTVHRGFASLEYQICDARISHKHQDAELTIAALCGLIRHFFGPAWQPSETHFEHGQGGLRRDYQRVFGEAVFDQNINAILIDSALLDRPMPQQNARAFAEFRALIRHQLASVDREVDLRSDRDSRLSLLAHVIQSQFKVGDASIGAVAKRVGLTVHGLRRQLKDCGVAYDEFVLSVRQVAARRYVESSDYDLTSIALMLGYSELSAFSRAFKRWHGQSPSALRSHATDR
ncbi:AraC family transcriptional regulator [Mesorhizobium tianshanense]|uniref:AraC-like DNA-binding protein n=2 Tax=Mesorhizobium tianshanense TaxID=39844 RepID=A0A562P307_9HYPH|nr:AraC-like DNA-binding protein [Mesorhizobium tianshanense]GLS38136.1 AraC family transcriptional regulator [Mesorhizobium tianshanense]